MGGMCHVQPIRFLEESGTVNVVVTEFMDDSGLAVLRDAGANVIADEGLWRESNPLLDVVGSADALIVRNQTQVDRRLLQSARRLKVVGRLGVGLDNIDVEACRERGIPVVFARGVNAPAVAEYVLAAMFSLVRPLLTAATAVRAGTWPRQAFTGGELRGKRLGVVGFGAVGREVAGRARAIGMDVITYDPMMDPQSQQLVELGVAYRELPELLTVADFVTLHVPLTPGTRHMIGPHQLRTMKPHAYLINTARGEIIDEEALFKALQEGQIAGAALDVRSIEPPPAGDKLSALECVISTPHVAGLTVESQAEIGMSVARDVLRVLTGARPLVTA